MSCPLKLTELTPMGNILTWSLLLQSTLQSNSAQNSYCRTMMWGGIVITLLCRDTISARTVVGHSLLLARLPGTHWVTICVIQRLALTVSDVFSRLVCFQSTSTYSALEVLHSMRYINLRLTYLLTYMAMCMYLSMNDTKSVSWKHKKGRQVLNKN